MGIIYKVTNKTNGKIYIGQTKNGLEKRKLGHENAAMCKNSSLVFHRALRKYGIDNFEWEIVEECDESLLGNREKYYICEFKSYIYLYPKSGYNMTEGGEGGNTVSNHPNKKEIFEKRAKTISIIGHFLNRMSYEEREAYLDKHIRGENHFLNKMSYEEHEAYLDKHLRGENNFLNKMSYEEHEAYLDKHLRGENNPMYGRIMTDEERKAASIRMTENNPFKGKNHTEETKLKMSISGKGKITGEKNPNYGKKGKDSHFSKRYIITLKSGYEFFVHGIDEFCDWYKETFGIILQPQNISTTAKGKNKHHKGLLVRFYDLEKDNNVKYWKDVLEEIKKENKNAS